MTKETILKGVEIINYAIDNNISLHAACIFYKKNAGYVKTIKMRMVDEQKDDLYDLFFNTYKEYLESTTKINNVEKRENVKKMEYANPTFSPNLEKALDKNSITFTENGNEATLLWCYNSKHIKTLQDLLDATEVDLSVWEVKDYAVNKWDVTSWKSGNVEISQNFQVKARLVKKVEAVIEKNLGEIFKEMIADYKPPVFNQVLSKDVTPNILEVTLFDLHLGKLAWGKESGENYDSNIARERFLTTIKTLLNDSKGFEYSRILFPIGSDFFNSDTIENTTTGGTPQDEDLRWKKTFRIGSRLLIDAINYMRAEANVPIDVIVIPGNHDYQRSYYVGEYLSAWFKDDKYVHINNGPEPRKYYKFGQVLLGFTHGSEEKEGSLPMLMASDKDSKKYWSDTKFHEWHLGHIHRKRDVVFRASKKVTNEDLGVIVRYLSSLTGTEEWHFKKGFVGSIKAGEAFIWNCNTGMKAHLNANLVIE